ncbi:carbohydrate ABC transporter substrate-binding protein [Candidatus Gracilibacteria bacterium]|nr:carbohydrate ABC transporter substrate-binding protein [Candidatus Gracilibacteria bacterium]
MNKNKIVFLIIGIIIVVFLVSIFLLLSKTGEVNKNKNASKTGDFTIWILQDSKDGFNNFLNDFKSKNPNYKNTNFNIVSFSNYEEYYNTLISSFLQGNSPDIFLINNQDSEIFDKQISGIDPSVISPDDFRKNYDIVFSNDLIKKTKVDDKEVEFLIGVPMGYENLGLFYNFRDVKGKNLSTWANINEIVTNLRNDSGKITIGIGNGSTVDSSSDIITQFLMLEGPSSLEKITSKDAKSAISSYVRYGDENLDNKYDTLFSDLVANNKNNLDAFSAGDVQIIIGYPRLLDKIEKKGFSKTFLRASTFPTLKENSGNILVNYNTFVINKNTTNYQTAQDLMKYFSSVEGQKKYLEIFNYYMPTQLSLISDRLEENIKDGYNIKYKDFYNPSLQLTTFNKGIKNIYDQEVPNMLDHLTNGVKLFEKFQKKVLCIKQKSIKQENLQNSCE